jgi:hypothetical protein
MTDVEFHKVKSFDGRKNMNVARSKLEKSRRRAGAGCGRGIAVKVAARLRFRGARSCSSGMYLSHKIARKPNASIVRSGDLCYMQGSNAFCMAFDSELLWH